MNPEVKEPSYKSTRRYLWINAIFAWTVILVLAGAASLGSEQAVAFGSIAVPSLVFVIVGIIGVHRVTGSQDFKAQLQKMMAEQKELP